MARRLYLFPEKLRRQRSLKTERENEKGEGGQVHGEEDMKQEAGEDTELPSY